MPPCGDASRLSAAASPSAGRASASPSRRAGSPVTCADRSASRSATASWSGRSSDRPAKAGIRDGDLIVEIAGTPITEPDQLQELIASTMPFEVKVVGADERTVSVGGGASASGEA